MAKWTIEKYEAQREHIREQYQTMRGRANAWRDQHLAILFYQCGWTQQEIADKEGRTQPWVCYRLRFGRFCEFLITMVIKIPVNLGERRFRELWVTYGGNVPANSPAETKKFEAIIESEEWDLQIADKPRIDTAKLICERCVDNKYRTKDEIAEMIEEPDDGANRVSNAICGIKRENRGGLVVMEKVFAGGTIKYRFSKIKNAEASKVRAITVAAELAPIVEDMFAALNQKLSHDAVSLAKGHLHRLRALVQRYS